MTLLLLWAVLALSVACSSGGDTQASGGPLPPDLQAVLEQVAALRGLPAPEGVRAAAITREEIPETLKATLTGTDRTAFAHLTTLYRLLGHLGPNETYEDAYFGFAGNNLIGFYAPSQRTLYIITVDGKSVDFASLGLQERSTVAHELTHALQDGSFDVQKLFAGAADDLDWSLALNSVLEGDAVNVEGLWTRDHAVEPGGQRASSGGSMLPGPGSASDRGAAAPQLASAPASVEREFRFPYTTGVEWVSIVRSRTGNQPIDAALGGRRLTTAEIIHPDLFESGFEPAEVDLPDIATRLGSGWKHESGGAFGEFQLRNYLQLHLTALPATQAAAGWFGDRYDVYTNGAEAVAAFRIRFSSANDAVEFRAAQDDFFAAANAVVTNGTAVTAVFPGGQTTVRADTAGPDVLFVIGSSRAAAEAALSALSER